MTDISDEARDSHGRWTAGGGNESAPASQAAAVRTADGRPALVGLPQKPIQIGNVWYTPGPNGRLHDAAEAYMKSAGLPYDPPATYQKVDPDRATRIADEFDKMAHAPDDPAVKASYAALAKETLAQWQTLKATGLKVEWIKPGQANPYAASPRLAEMDVALNNHWWGFPTDMGFGTGPEAEAAMKDNPLLAPTDEVVDGRHLVVNDVFRIVHDMFGHAKEGVGFRADGEDNAWRSHAAMYSPLARAAMTSETRGQNSWVNYGPYGKQNRTANEADTHFAPQKIGLMPKWTQDEGRQDPPGVHGMSMPRWAAYFAKTDTARIDNAIKTGLIAGHDNTEIARKVVGSAALNGVDGVTEITRQQIGRLGRAAISPRRTSP